MTEMRDARLQRALHAVTDDAGSPVEATRESILRNAREVLARPASAAGRRWWQLPQYRVPLNAAFASVLVAGIITLLWYEQDVPDAKPERGADIAAPSAAPAPATQPAATSSTPAVAPAKAASAPAPIPAAPPSPSRSPLADRTEPPPPLRAPDDLAKKAESARRQDEERKDNAARRSEAPSAAARQEQSSRQLQAQPQVPAEAATGALRAAPAPAAPMAAPAPAPAATPAPATAPAFAPAPAPAAPPVAAAAPPRAADAAPTPRAPWEDWSEVRLEVLGRIVTVERARAFRLSEMLYGVINAPADSSGADEAMPIRITVSRIGLTVGVLELGPRHARWTPVNGPARTLLPTPEALRRLEQEVQRLSGS